MVMVEVTVGYVTMQEQAEEIRESGNWAINQRESFDNFAYAGVDAVPKANVFDALPQL